MEKGHYVNLSLAICPHCGTLTVKGEEVWPCCGTWIEYEELYTVVRVQGAVQEVFHLGRMAN